MESKNKLYIVAKDENKYFSDNFEAIAYPHRNQIAFPTAAIWKLL